MKAKLSQIWIADNAEVLWHQLRWKSTDGVVTCTCGNTDLYKLADGRYKCKKCGKVFSDKTGTLLHHSKLSVKQWMCGIFYYTSNPECSANTLATNINVNYKTAYLMLQKLRYLSGKEEISLDGVVRVDEAYIGAEWHNVHFNKKMDYMRSNGFIAKDSKRYTKTQLLRAVSAKKSHIIGIIDEHDHTRLVHMPNPITKDAIRAYISKFNITEIISDESSLYKGLSIPVFQSNHSKHIFMTENGLTSNACENRFSWTKRKIEAIYTHTSDKYLQFYLWQRQYHFNHINESVDDKYYGFMDLVCGNVITCNDIANFNYKNGFPISRREKEKRMWSELVDGGLVNSMDSRYGNKYIK